MAPVSDMAGAGESLMTAWERRAYLSPDPVADFGAGYPAGLSPGWIRYLQKDPPAGYLDVPPARYVTAIAGYFARLLGVSRVTLAPDCSMAFTAAMRAVLAGRGGEVVMLAGSYDSHALITRALGGTVVLASRGSGFQVSAALVTNCFTPRTRAVVLCSPDNPLGTVIPRETLAGIGLACRDRGITLIADHCLAQVSPYGTPVPLASRLEGTRGLRWIAIGDTGKILGAAGSKFGALAASAHWDGRLEEAASPWYFQFRQFDLAVLATVLSDERFPGYLRYLNDRIAANLASLETGLDGRYRVIRPQAGCFCLLDVRALHFDDQAFAQHLAGDHGALVIPLSLSWAGRAAPSTWVRVALSRSERQVAALAGLLNAVARERALAVISQHWAIAGGLLPLAGFAGYARDTWRGTTRPSRVSWALWAIAPLIAFAAGLGRHAPAGTELVTLALGLGPLAVLAASFAGHGAYWHLRPLDAACGVLALAALAALAVARQGTAAVALAVAADALAAVPTIAKARSDPDSESAGTYLASGAGSVIGLLTVRHWAFAGYGFPAYAACVCGVILFFLARPR